MTHDDSSQEGFSRLDRRIIVGGMGACFCIAPLLPSAVHFDAAFSIRSFVLLCLMLIAGRLGWTAIIQRAKTVPYLLPALLTLSVMGITCVYSPNLYGATESLVIGATLLSLLVVLLCAPLRDKDRSWLVVSLVFGGVLSATLALSMQWAGHGETIEQLQQTTLYDDAMRDEMIRSLEANRALGRFGNPNHLAGYLVLCLWGCWWLWSRTQSLMPRITILAGAALLATGTYQTFSRSGLLVLAVSLLMMTGLELRARGLGIPVRWIVGGLIAGALGLLALVFVLPPDWFGGRLLTLSTVVARMHFYRGALEIIQASPWIGVGLNSYEAYYSEVLRPGDLESRYVHNWLLESVVEGGVLLLAVCLWLLMAVIRFLWMNPVEASSRSTACAGGTLIVFVLLASIDFHNRLFELWLPLILFLGLASATVSPPRVSTSSSRWGLLLTCTVALLWCGLVLPRYVNEQTRQDGYGFTANEQFPEARSSYQWAVTAVPYDAESWHHLGLLWRSVPTRSAQAESLRCLSQAVWWAPRRASIRTDYAETLFALGYTIEAKVQMHTALEHFPSRKENYIRAAALFRAAGDNPQAEAFEAEAQRIETLIEERNP